MHFRLEEADTDEPPAEPEPEQATEAPEGSAGQPPEAQPVAPVAAPAPAPAAAAAAAAPEAEAEPEPCTCPECTAILERKAAGKKVTLKEKRVMREHAAAQAAEPSGVPAAAASEPEAKAAAAAEVPASVAGDAPPVCAKPHRCQGYGVSTKYCEVY